MKSFRDHLIKSSDLVTTYNETRSGFISIALEKNRRATPYVEEARALQLRVKSAKAPNDLFGLIDIRFGLIAAAGISDKAAGHLGEEGCNDAIKEFIENFLIPAGDKFQEELVFRYLLTKGDSLGGSMRNIIGALSQKKLNTSLLAALRLNRKPYKWLHESSKCWVSSEESVVESDNAKGLSWTNKNMQNHVLYYNITVPIVKNNIDIILLDKSHDVPLKNIISQPANYIALGELKGGIDPAGADEHWKTSKTAIDRIVSAFKKRKQNPAIFYVGAAIESKMATEIWNNLSKKYITNAGNLTKPDHITSLAEWLLDL
jgi:Restriction endonuclease BsobI.